MWIARILLGWFILQGALAGAEWSVPTAGNQHDQPICTGYAWYHLLRSKPFAVQHPPSPALIHYWGSMRFLGWYRWDGIPIVYAGRALVQHHFIAGCHETVDLDEILEFLGNRGPVVVGTHWYETMHHPDAKGMVEVTPDDRDIYHAWLLFARHGDVLEGLNSFGRDWGQDGHFFITVHDFTSLIDGQGFRACLVEPSPHFHDSVQPRPLQKVLSDWQQEDLLETLCLTTAIK